MQSQLFHKLFLNNFDANALKKEEIWLSPLTKVHLPTEKQGDNAKNATTWVIQ